MNAHLIAKDAPRIPAHLIAHINVKLALIGCSPVPLQGDQEFVEIAAAMAAQSREKDRLLGQHLCPADQRIQNFLHDYLAGNSGAQAAGAHVHARPRRPRARAVAAGGPR